MNLKPKICKCGNKALKNRRICWDCLRKREREKRFLKLKLLKERKRIKSEKKENSIKSLRGKADLIWFRKFLKDFCEVCGVSGVVLQGHHFFYKKNYAGLRYVEENHITLCKVCHAKLHFQDPKEIEAKIIVNRGKKWYDSLIKIKKERAGRSSFINVKYYQDIIVELKDLENETSMANRKKKD